MRIALVTWGTADVGLWHAQDSCLCAWAIAPLLHQALLSVPCRQLCNASGYGKPRTSPAAWVPHLPPCTSDVFSCAIVGSSGNIEIDSDVYDELRRTGQFDVLDLPSDEVCFHCSPHSSLYCCLFMSIRGYQTRSACRQNTAWSCRWRTLCM